MNTLGLGDVDLLGGLIAVFPVVFTEAKAASGEEFGCETSYSDYRR